MIFAPPQGLGYLGFTILAIDLVACMICIAICIAFYRRLEWAGWTMLAVLIIILIPWVHGYLGGDGVPFGLATIFGAIWLAAGRS